MLVGFGLKLATTRERFYDTARMRDSLCVLLDSVRGRNTCIQLAFAMGSEHDIYNGL